MAILKLSGINRKPKPVPRVPEIDGPEEMMKECDVNAYPFQHATNVFAPGDFSEDTKKFAVRTVASHYGITNHEALQQFEIRIVPGIGFHGRIVGCVMAKMRS